MSFSPGELILIAMLVGLVFGWSWVPKMGEKVGDFIAGYKKGARENSPDIVVKPHDTSKK